MTSEKAEGLPETIRFVENSEPGINPNGDPDDSEKLIIGLPDVSKKTPEEIEKEEEARRYYKLSKPLNAGGRVLDKLLVDPSDLGGDVYFKLAAAFRTNAHYVYSTSLNKLAEDVYLGLVLAELNRIIPEDLRKLSFKDLQRALNRVQLFLYSSD
jgi:hypothetical protein